MITDIFTMLIFAAIRQLMSRIYEISVQDTRTMILYVWRMELLWRDVQYRSTFGKAGL